MSKTLKMSATEEDIVVTALLDELREMAEAAAEEFQCGPFTPIDVADARWKIERMGAVVAMLERVGFIEPKQAEDTYAGTAFSVAER